MNKYQKHPYWFRLWVQRFYNSKDWKALRQKIRNKNKMRCSFCKLLITGKSICDHIVEINPNNYKDINITMNENNLRLLCLPCHNKRTFKGIAKQKPIDFDLKKRKSINLF